MRRQGYITIALATSPKYLLLDEALDGLDPLARISVKNELIRLVDGVIFQVLFYFIPNFLGFAVTERRIIPVKPDDPTAS